MVISGFRLDIGHPPCGSLSLPWMIGTSPVALAKLPGFIVSDNRADGATGGALAGR